MYFHFGVLVSAKVTCSEKSVEIKCTVYLNSVFFKNLFSIPTYVFGTPFRIIFIKFTGHTVDFIKSGLTQPINILAYPHQFTGLDLT